MIRVGDKVAIVDDELYQADAAAGLVEEVGLVPLILSETEGPFSNTAELLERVQAADCSAVICDHRLNNKQFATFDGAAFLAELYVAKIPAILLSTFSAIDSDTSIRLHRASIPSVLSRQDLEPEGIFEGLKRCEQELAGDVSPERRSWRTLVRIVSVNVDVDKPVVEAILINWKADTAIRFPLDSIDDVEVRKALAHKQDDELRVFAEVNIGCETESELFFRHFELAPEPNIDELKV